MIAEIIYVSSTLVSVACAWLLARSYLRNRARILLWVAVSFGFLALNNVFVCVDLILLPEMELWGAVVRNCLLAVAGSVLAAGLAWELS